MAFQGDITIIDVTDGEPGAHGINTATIYLYQRSSSTLVKPTDTPSGILTYNFTTKELTPTSTLGNWKQDIGDLTGSDPIYVIVATVSSVESTDQISPTEWSSPIKMAQNGQDGVDGLPGAHGVNSATVYLYQRATSAPAKPTADITYTFDGATLSPSSALGNWKQSISDLSGTNPIWVIAAVASSTATTDVITSSDWSSQVKMAQNGSNGTNGYNQATVYIYKRGTSVTKPASATYTFSSGSFTVPSGWSKEIPTSDGNPCYVCYAVAISRSSTATLTWNDPTKIVEDGQPGLDGYNQTTVSLYQRKSGIAPTRPSYSGSITYNFETHSLSTIPTGWSASIPVDDGNPCYVTTATALSRTAEASIESSAWSGVVKLVEDGRGIHSITYQYCTYGAGQPPVNDQRWGDVWPSYDVQYPNYWIKRITTYTDDLSNPVSVVYKDQAATDSNGAAKTAKDVAEEVQAKLKYFWTHTEDLASYPAGTYAASGISGVTFNTSDSSTYGFNSVLRHTDLKFRYNAIDLTTIGVDGLQFNVPTITNSVITNSVKGATIDSNGLKVFENTDSVRSVASFGPVITLGKEYVSTARDNQSYITLDFHSFQMIDDSNEYYVFFSDLRDRNGKATLTDTFIGDGETRSFHLSLTPTNSNYTVTVQDGSGGTITKDTLGITFLTAPTKGTTITAIYDTTSSECKAYTLGHRKTAISNNIGAYSVAEGWGNIASGYISHAEGYETTASGFYASHAEGDQTIASGIAGAHAEGMKTTASGNGGAHAEGVETTASGEYGAHAEGVETTASGDEGAHAEGDNTTASGGNGAHAEGSETIASGFYGAHAEGWKAVASGDYCAHAEGYETTASGRYGSHAEGYYTTASGEYGAHAEGWGSTAEGSASHAEGEGTAIGKWSHAEGDGEAYGNYSHAEGGGTEANDSCAHAEGRGSYANGSASHAEGDGTTAAADYSHAEGYRSETGSQGEAAHAEGYYCKANGKYSHAEGRNCEAVGSYSHAGGYYTTANGESQTVIGKRNKTDTTSLFIVGNGNNSVAKNAFEVDGSGNAKLNGSTTVTSDRRLKEHISYLSTDATDFINQLKPVYFKKDAQPHVGFYAQDVEQIDPWHCMVGEMNDFKTLGYTEIIAPLVAYCQHLESEIQQLQQEIKELKGE